LIGGGISGINPIIYSDSVEAYKVEGDTITKYDGPPFENLSVARDSLSAVSFQTSDTEGYIFFSGGLKPLQDGTVDVYKVEAGTIAKVPNSLTITPGASLGAVSIRTGQDTGRVLFAIKGSSYPVIESFKVVGENIISDSAGISFTDPMSDFQIGSVQTGTNSGIILVGDIDVRGSSIVKAHKVTSSGITELEDLAPLTNSLRRINIYSVPSVQTGTNSGIVFFNVSNDLVEAYKIEGEIVTYLGVQKLFDKSKMYGASVSVQIGNENGIVLYGGGRDNGDSMPLGVVEAYRTT
jgi:hypothetical protein